jgi:hypothetical protein
VGGIDIDLADRLARREAYNKHLYRPLTYLHKWWARRCGTTFRLILKSLVEDPSARDYYVPGGLAGKIILDPMMGGGTTLHEAIRMGANVIGADIDPIPVLQARATLSAVPLKELEAGFSELQRHLRASLAGLYQTTCPSCGTAVEAQYTLHARRRLCACGPRRFVDSLILRREARGKAVRLCARCRAVIVGDAPCRCSPHEDGVELAEKGALVCERCGQPYHEDRTVAYYARYEPLVEVGRCRTHGLFFAPVSRSLRGAIRQADEQRLHLGFPAAAFHVQAGPKSSDLIRSGIDSYLDLFSSRQLLYLHHAIDRLSSFSPLVRLNLALLVSTSLEFNSMLCGYKGGHSRRPGAIRHTFSHHAYSFPYTALENNPLYNRRASGSLRTLYADRIRRGRNWALMPEERFIREGSTPQLVSIEGEADCGTEVAAPQDLLCGTRRFLLVQGSSVRLDLPSDSVDYIVTDPPYFDSVQYGDLARYFHVWLRQILPTEARWEYSLEDAAVDPQANGNGQYARVLTGILSECYRVIRKDCGRLVFTYHHWNPKGWADLTMALRKARFRLVEYHVVHSENPVSVHIANLKALKHDAILFLAPITAKVEGSWLLPDAIDQRDSGRFCGDCAGAVGWMLSDDAEGADIPGVWRRLLGS